MVFDRNILLPALTDIIQRRPKDVRSAGNTPAIIKAGHSAEINLAGQFLEGNCSLHCDSSRINLENVRQQGEFEDTNLLCVANATSGDDLNGIDLHGYTFGQENNPTAKFSVADAINIKDSDPRITDVKTYWINSAYPESSRFIITSENCTSYRLETDGKVLTSSTPDFVYTYQAPGIKGYSVQGFNSDGEASAKWNGQLRIHSRPFINYMRLDVDTNIADFAFCQVYGLDYSQWLIDPIFFEIVPTFQVISSGAPGGGAQQSNLNLFLGFNLGSTNSSISNMVTNKTDTDYYSSNTLTRKLISKWGITLSSSQSGGYDYYGNMLYYGVEHFFYFTPINNYGMVGARTCVGILQLIPPPFVNYITYTNNNTKTVSAVPSSQQCFASAGYGSVYATIVPTSTYNSSGRPGSNMLTQNATY